MSNTIAQVPGIYYLEGVMETASGFKLNPDSTFEFFFSQGALDRTGSGKWTMDGDKIIFNNTTKLQDGFMLNKSELHKGKKTKIVVNEPNSMLLSFVYYKVNEIPGDAFGLVGPDGFAESEITKPEKIELLFELCPERIHSYTPKTPGDNYFEFTINSDIMLVPFENFSLTFKDGHLEGKHPLMKGEEFFYRNEK